MGAAGDGCGGPARPGRRRPGPGPRPPLRRRRAEARRAAHRPPRRRGSGLGARRPVVTGAAGPRRRRGRGEGRSSSPRRARSSTVGSGCRPSSAAPARRPTASPTSAPRSAPPPSSPSTPTPTATRSWCSCTSWTPTSVGGLYAPAVFDLRDGLLVQAVAEDPDLLLRGDRGASRAAGREHYDLVRSHAVLDGGGPAVLQPLGRRVRARQHDAAAARALSWSTSTSGGWTTTGSCAPVTPSCRVMAPEGQAPCGSRDDEGFLPTSLRGDRDLRDR